MTAEDKDWESSDSEDDDDDSQDDDDDNNASDQDDIEASVLAAFGGKDLALAAYLIPILYREKYSRSVSEIARKVGPWWFAVNNAARATGSPGDVGNGSGSSRPLSGSRKRQRMSGSSNFNQDQNDSNCEDNDESEGSGGGGDDGPGNRGSSQRGDDPVPLLRLACPFHKLNPDKYGVQHGQAEPADNSKKQIYRSCAGPGFRTIQRLK